MILRRSPHCLTLYISPLAFRIIAGFIIGLGVIVLCSVRLDNLAPLFPAILILLVGLLILQHWGGSTIVYFDKQKGLVSVHHQKLLGAKSESFDIPLNDVVDICVEQNSSVSYDEGVRGRSKQTVTHYFQLFIKVREGYSLPLTRCGTAGNSVEQKYQTIAQEIKQFLNL